MDPTGLKYTKMRISYIINYVPKIVLGIFIFNFLFLNLGMSILQFPFSSSSSLATRFVYLRIDIQGVPKKSGISVQRSFYALKWPKIKKSKETDPP